MGSGSHRHDTMTCTSPHEVDQWLIVLVDFVGLRETLTLINLHFDEPG